MPTYALLGATGSIGSAILRCILSQPSEHLTLNIFVRSKSKLRKKFPDLESTITFKTNIIEGISSDTAAMQECLNDADVVMACIGSNYSTPGMSLIYDTTTAIINALEVHQMSLGSAYKPPTIIQLRSASLNPVFRACLPWLARNIASFCFYYVYEDLDRTCKLLASSVADSTGLLNYIFVDPPSIHDADGTAPTGYKLILDGKQDPALSYADLGAAFCQVAERRDEFAGEAVGVTATGIVNQTVGTLFGYIVAGAKGRIWG
ncbi:hypothetical protein H2198_002530 [Neophaeococcomyces mojaviensis]|uniref:Uncharacterized protein n=1 Tax=Neophaeococcomyces mojaviensis TaxID=3383035 RepID=A0ACC3AEA1_9EURO|nr:hypothetical protein H2198_002530 [Knufia sp. JES_112]